MYAALIHDVFLVLTGGFYYGMKWMFRPKKEGLVQANLRLRLALSDVERSLLIVYNKAFDASNVHSELLLSSQESFSGKYRSLSTRSQDRTAMNQAHRRIAHGLLHYNIYRLRQELAQYFCNPYSSSSGTMTFELSTARLLDENGTHNLTLGWNSWIWPKMEIDPSSELFNILNDIRDLESSDDVVPGIRKIMTAIRMRGSYKCFNQNI